MLGVMPGVGIGSGGGKRCTNDARPMSTGGGPQRGGGGGTGEGGRGGGGGPGPAVGDQSEMSGVCFSGGRFKSRQLTERTGQMVWDGGRVGLHCHRCSGESVQMLFPILILICTGFFL